MSQPPICLFPTTTLIVDDNHDLLSSLKKYLTNARTIIKTLDSSYEADIYLSSLKQAPLIESCLSVCPSDYSYEDLNIEIQFSKILRLYSNPQRFNQITCLIIDYCMPGKNGIQVMEGIEDRSIKRILLTGHADAEMAIDAVNRGLIDFYVKKQDPNMGSILKELVHKIQLSYFSELTSFIKNALTIFRQNDEEILDSYQSLVNNIISKNGIIEYYVSDLKGSSVFFSDLKKINLLIESQDEIQSRLSTSRLNHTVTEAQALSRSKTFFYSLSQTDLD